MLAASVQTPRLKIYILSVLGSSVMGITIPTIFILFQRGRIAPTIHTMLPLYSVPLSRVKADHFYGPRPRILAETYSCFSFSVTTRNRVTIRNYYCESKFNFETPKRLYLSWTITVNLHCQRNKIRKNGYMVPAFTIVMTKDEPAYMYRIVNIKILV